MKCMSCEANIPAEWQAAITNNNCPACGGQIMTDHIKRVSDNLRTVVGQLVDLGEEQMDLLLDTFGLRRKPVPGSKQAREQAYEEESLPPNFKVASNPVQDFLSRTNAPHLAHRQEKIKDILSRIEGATDEPIEMDSGDDFNYPQMHASASEDPLASDGSPPTPEELMALKQSIEAEGPYVDDEPDIDPTLHPALQKDRMKRLMQSRGVATGSGGGSFRRGS